MMQAREENAFFSWIATSDVQETRLKGCLKQLEAYSYERLCY